MSELEFDVDVLIVGAGMAGLTAARALAERGLKVLVVEARDHVGGRVMSRRADGGETVELGAEFVHGRAPELFALMDEAKVEIIERGGAMLREEEPGVLIEDDDRDEEFFAPLETLEDSDAEDVPFAEWLAGQEMEPWQKDVLTGYVEGFNAADAKRIGIRALGVQQKAEDAAEGDRSWHVRGGYAQLPEYLARRVRELGGDVRLNTKVRALQWEQGRVTLETSGGTFTARKCVVTLPLGVLQQVNERRGVVMSPVPAAIAQARRLAMGHAVRFTMVFREAWWLDSEMLGREKLRELSFLFTLGEAPTVWWTPHPEREAFPTLTGWAGGPRAEALAGKSAGELGRSACARLAAAFGVEEDVVRASLLATYAHDWSGDPLSLGAYSYVPAGAMDAPAKMGEPEAETLYFAGEHTDVTGHWGTVHAAMRSGLRVATQMLGE